MVIVKPPGAYLDHVSDEDLALALAISQEEHMRRSLDAKEFLPVYDENPPFQLYPTFQALPSAPELPQTLPQEPTSVDKVFPGIENHECLDCGRRRCIKHLSSQKVTGIVSWFLLMDLSWVLFFASWTIVFSIFTTCALILPIIGVPLFVGFAYTWRGLALADAKLLSHLTGCNNHVSMKLNHGNGLFKTFKAISKSSQTWTSALYAWIRLIMAILIFPVAWLCFFAWFFTLFCVQGRTMFYPVILFAFWQRRVAEAMLSCKVEQNEPVVRI
jgi:hypothetical protein